MEEYRGSRNANGRMQEAHWLLMMEGSKVKPSLYLDLSLHGLRSLVPETLFLFYGGHNLLVWQQYAKRLPIGLEKVIRTVSPESVKKFYKKWYQMQNMAVIAVGDFPDTQVRRFLK